MATPYELRESAFGEAYEDLEPTDVHQLIVRTGDWLELLLLDDVVVNDVMTLIYERVVADLKTEMEGRTWRELWEAGDDSWPALRAQFMVALNAYAFWGLHPDQARTFVKERDDDAAVEAFVDQARAFLDAIPPNWGNVEHLAPTVLAAEARVRLDTGRDVTPDQLAALARVSLKSIRNLMTPKGGISDLRPNQAGNIPAADARRWLQARHGYNPSVWQEAPQLSGTARPAATPVIDLGEVFFVPVAKDGTWFDPATCRRGGGYTIGSKGAEETYEDFRKALDRLSRMGTPQWRRPNPAGHWGLVSAVGWQRKLVNEIGEFAKGAE
jgi:hypothetical protein